MTTIKRINAWSAAKLMAVTYFFMGLIIGVIQGVAMIFVSGIVKMSNVGTSAPKLALFAGAGFMSLLFVVVITTVMGFVTGLIGGWIYNLVARFVGGIKIELVTETEVKPNPGL